MNGIIAERLPAEIYDEKFVPALFRQWGQVMVDEAGITPGQSVLDVACGTGAATLAACERVGPSGRVTGLDANPEMLAVARSKPVNIEWLQGMAEALPVDDRTFDAVISQFGFMFFEDRAKALTEMMRVLRPGGRLAVAVCGAVDRSPGYNVLANLLDQLFGETVGNAFRAPFILGHPETFRHVAVEAGLADAAIEEHNGTVQFPSIADLVATERDCVWTLGGLLNQEQFDLLLRECTTALKPFTDDQGLVRFDMPALILKTSRSV